MSKENEENIEKKIEKKDDLFSKIEYNGIVINTEFITLDRFLKFSGIAPSGGISKMMILDGLIYINQEIITKRKTKLRRGDRVVFLEDETYHGFEIE